jgi:hypothetical protein
LAALGGGDRSKGAARLLEAATDLGAQTVHFTIGALSDRHSPDCPWPRFLDQAAALARPLARRAAALGLDLALKSHEEMTDADLLYLLAAVNSPALRIGLSPTNLAVTLTDPVTAAQRLAGQISVFFIDDSRVVWTRRGLRRTLTPLGDGGLPWAQILALADPEASRACLLDLHRASFEIPIFEESWRRGFPDLSATQILGFDGRNAVPGPPPADAAIEERRLKGLDRLAATAGLAGGGVRGSRPPQTRG